MTFETSHAIIDEAFELVKNGAVTFAFQGGEPTLVGLDFFKDFSEYAVSNKGPRQLSFVLQTNGLLLDANWIDYLRLYNYLVGLSVDAVKEIHDEYRTTVEGEVTFDAVLNAIKALKNGGVAFNVLAVLTKQLAKKPREVFNFCLDNQIEFIQFIPCIDKLYFADCNWALAPREFAYFYCRLFDLWLSEIQKDNYISVGLFDSIMELSLGVIPHQCGALGTCANQLVIESNGDVYPCDFYAIDKYFCGNISHDSFLSILNSENARAFNLEPKLPCTQCSTCRYEKICHRGCKRTSSAYYNETYCGYQEFLDYSYNTLSKIALEILRLKSL